MKKNKTKEIWTPARYINNDGTVLSFENYEVSNLGRVRNVNYRCTGKIRMLSLSIFECSDSTIYYTVGLRKDCKLYRKIVHRLVLSSFDQEGWSENAVVNHKVERTATSCIDELSNLEWLTQKENTNTDHCKKLHTNNKYQSKRVKVTDLSTGEITTYPSASEAERSLGIPLSTVSAMIKNQKGYYKKLNLHFEYVL